LIKLKEKIPPKESILMEALNGEIEKLFRE
jgi:hypothetical protein